LTDKVTRLREPFDATEDAAALSFAKLHPDLRYCHTWGQWLQWDKTVWRPDQTVNVFDMIRKHCREQSEWSAQTPADSRKFCSPPFVAGVERFCKADRKYAVTAERFDADDWLLNTPVGMVSLKDGRILPHDAGAYCTKMTAVGSGGDCPRWQNFLNFVTQGCNELMAYLQRLAGYCLTGSTREHALIFFYGTGGNGKGTFLDTLQGVLNDYALTAPSDTFAEARGERHPTELAMLDGPRLVLAQETEEGRKWAETRIKQLTGGDMIAARRMRQDFFQFRPRFKLIIAGNHKPALSSVDEAMRRRFHVVPFEAVVTAENRVRDMAELLREEWPGILSWAIAGCLEYVERDGLDPPKKVVTATEEYLQSQDVLHEWMEDACERGPEFWEAPRLLFDSWRTWAKSANEPIGKQTEFKARMEAAGFRQYKDNVKGRNWPGIRCKPRENQDRDW
jgi:putative DNA primase/helicase